MTKLERLESGELEIQTRKGDTMVINGKLIEENGKKFFKIKAKKKYISNRNPFKEIDKLTDKKICIHCGKEIIVGDYKILIEKNKKNELLDYIVCPNAPECDGTIMDWQESTEKRRLFYNIDKIKKPSF